jgi:hypothetical protein
MLATNLLRVSVSLITLAMAAAIGLAIAQDIRLTSAHAALNLVGYITLFLAGLYYHSVPHAAESGLATLHVWFAVTGAIIFPIGITAVLLGGARFEIFAIIGSLIVFTSMLLFAMVVFRHSAPKRA